MRRFLAIFGWLVAALAVPVAAYVGYVLLDYHRVEDNQALEIVQNTEATLVAGREYAAVSWNLGFGAYTDSYDFFMDGGESSRALSKRSVEENTAAMAARIAELDADFALLQEVDVDSDRSWHVDQRALLTGALADRSACFAVNYDSAYLFWPLTQPIGRSLSGLLTLSGARVDAAVRRSLPLEAGFLKLLDLDRCYTVLRLPVEGGGTLCLYNLHLSAYTTDGSIATEQLRLLLADMARQYAQGNYVLAAGDFNKDLAGNSASLSGVSDTEYPWAQPFPTALLPEGISLSAGTNAPSCRNADTAYTPGKTFVLTADGFLTSANIEVLSCETVDEAFRLSDHNPVLLRFRLA